MASLNRNQTGSNAVLSAVAVTTTAKRVVTPRFNRVSLSLRNNGDVDLFVGGPNVTTATGYPIKSGEEYEFVDFLGELWVIAASAGDLRYIEVY